MPLNVGDRMQIKRTSLLFEISNIRIRAETITEADNFIHECLMQEKEAVYYNVYMRILCSEGYIS